MRPSQVWSVAVGLLVAGAVAGPGTRAAFAEAPLPPGTPMGSAATLIKQAARALVMGQLDEALALSEQALASDPQSAWAHYTRAEALAALGRPTEAAEAYAVAAMDLNAADVRGRALALWGRALALRDSGRCDQARRAFTDYAVTIRPIDPQAALQAEAYLTVCQDAAPPVAIASAASPGRPSPAAATPATPREELAPSGTRYARVSDEEPAAAPPGAGSEPAAPPPAAAAPREPSEPPPAAVAPRESAEVDLRPATRPTRPDVAAGSNGKAAEPITATPPDEVAERPDTNPASKPARPPGPQLKAMLDTLNEGRPKPAPQAPVRHTASGVPMPAPDGSSPATSPPAAPPPASAAPPPPPRAAPSPAPALAPRAPATPAPRATTVAPRPTSPPPALAPARPIAPPSPSPPRSALPAPAPAPTALEPPPVGPAFPKL
jgi:hypothetical protein